MEKSKVNINKQLICALVLVIIPTHTTRHTNPIQKKQVASEYQESVKCLAKNIYWEAGSESINGKEAVAQVTINRLKTKNFPKKVCSVVYERNKSTATNKIVCQFSWTCTTKKSTNPPRNSKAWKESLKVAQRFLKDGYRVKNLKAALYYHADYIEEPSWTIDKIRLEQIGKHIFYSASNT